MVKEDITVELHPHSGHDDIFTLIEICGFNQTCASNVDNFPNVWILRESLKCFIKVGKCLNILGFMSRVESFRGCCDDSIESIREWSFAFWKRVPGFSPHDNCIHL